jgi:hypothetical protein
LGDLSRAGADYLDPHRIFDLEICLEDVSHPRVEPEVDGSS